MAILDGKALRDARGKKGWTQHELRHATNDRVDISTISRIERGKPTRVRANTLKVLAKALDVRPESLCEGREAERDVMKLRIQPAARNALTLVALRYRTRRENIIEIAPLLFHIFAEQSLQERQRRIVELKSAAEHLLDRQLATARHLPVRHTIDPVAVDSEEQSIMARDLFGEKVFEEAAKGLSGNIDHYDDAEQNPFVASLRDALTKVGQSEASESVWWIPGTWPNYEICTEEAGNIVGNDDKAVRAIVCGDAVLHEMPKGTPEQRAAWARAELDRKNPDIDPSFRDLIGRIAADGQASNSGDAS